MHRTGTNNVTINIACPGQQPSCPSDNDDQPMPWQLKYLDGQGIIVVDDDNLVGRSFIEMMTAFVRVTSCSMTSSSHKTSWTAVVFHPMKYTMMETESVT
jgi:hypothetical protein